MKRRLTALLLALVLAASCLISLADYGQEKYDYIQSVADFIREHGLYSGMDDDPLEDALIEYLDSDPRAFDLIMTYMMDAVGDGRTMYIPASYMGQVLQTSGYVGVGVTLSHITDDGDPRAQVTAVHEAGSARRAGVQEGDVVISVDGIPADELEFAAIGDILRGSGEEGTFVDLEVRRGEAVLIFTLERIFIGDKEYSSRRIEDGIWYMKWASFRTEEALEAFAADVQRMAADSAKALILDLRGNPGGRVDMAFDIVDALVPKADLNYITMSGRNGHDVTRQRVYTAGGGLALGQIIVLCDGGTASASEIIMAGLCDTGFAVSVGQRTYGKATAQYEIETPEDSLVILTSFKMSRPGQEDYDLIGMEPTYAVENQEAPAPATDLRLRDIALSFGNCSDDAEKLNAALGLLGLMGAPQKAYRLGDATQAAINNLRQQHGLPRIEGLDRQTAALINTALAGLGQQMVTTDFQLEKALELARAALDQPLKYTVGDDGLFVNN